MTLQGTTLELHSLHSVVLQLCPSFIPKKQQVEVKSNSLRAEGMIAIAEALKVNSTVTRIDVSDNEIGRYGGKSTPEGPAALAEALKVNTTVQWVIVKDNRIGDEGKQALGQALLANHRSSIAAFDCDEWTIGLSTTSLDVSCKRLTSCDGIVLAGVLKSNTSVTTVRKRRLRFSRPQI